MKKIYGLLLFLISCFILPMGVNASQYGIENFNMHVTVLENGDLYVKEIFSMNGSYNGMDRELYYKNKTGGETLSLEGGSLYDGSAIELVKIKSVPFKDSISWEEIEQSGTQFEKVTYASSGEFGVYTETNTGNGVTYRIFNPSSKKSSFYLEYIMKDMAVMHEDVAEIGWNIFGSNFRESIHHLDIDIVIPNNKELLRAWGHGPLTANVELDGKNHIHIFMDGLNAYEAMDTRFIFDQAALTNVTKKSGFTAMDTIIQIETEKADIANAEREEARKLIEQEERHRKNMMIFTSFLSILWIGGLLFLIRYVYQKHDKEYESTFKTEYFRDFPADYNPSTVGYLFHRNISNDDLSACLLNLIYKKVVTFEPIGKKDYKFIYHETDVAITEADQKLIKFIFKGQSEMLLSILKKKAKNSYQSFISDYSIWKQMAIKEAEQEQFFEEKSIIKLKSSLYSFLGIMVGIFTVSYAIGIGSITILFAIASMIYFMSFTKKTPKGNEDYLKWKALKHFMEDFGQIDKKDLPEIVLWEKYLVYAVSLGCANKLSKTMEIRVNELTNADMVDMYYDMHMMRNMMVFNRIISDSINSTMNTAYAARSAASIASSSNSSGGGFGGGFSGGGGSFGGGSGGGRF